MGREKTQKFSSTKSLAGASDSALEPTTNSTNADVSSAQSGNMSNDQKGAVGVWLDIGKKGFYQTNLPKKETKTDDYFGKAFDQLFNVSVFKPYDQLPTVNPETHDQDTNQQDSNKFN